MPHWPFDQLHRSSKPRREEARQQLVDAGAALNPITMEYATQFLSKRVLPGPGKSLTLPSNSTFRQAQHLDEQVLVAGEKKVNLVSGSSCLWQYCPTKVRRETSMAI